jgi:UDP-N-acetylenolpyruvoylglucosamine reductase
LGIIINIGGATSKDITWLIEHVKREAREKMNIELEEEIIYFD